MLKSHMNKFSHEFAILLLLMNSARNPNNIAQKTCDFVLKIEHCLRSCSAPPEVSGWSSHKNGVNCK